MFTGGGRRHMASEGGAILCYQSFTHSLLLLTAYQMALHWSRLPVVSSWTMRDSMLWGTNYYSRHQSVSGFLTPFLPGLLIASGWSWKLLGSCFSSISSILYRPLSISIFLETSYDFSSMISEFIVFHSFAQLGDRAREVYIILSEPQVSTIHVEI